MEEIIDTNQINIKDLILTVRGTQVLLDSDVAMLYGYESKQINQTARRNNERFPEHFRFILSLEEYDYVLSLRSQIATLKRGEHRKYRPYVYTEQGIAMLSGILRNETAVKVSIGIMDAFVDMRCSAVELQRSLRSSSPNHPRFQPSGRKSYSVASGGVEPPTPALADRCSTVELRSQVLLAVGFMPKASGLLVREPYSVHAKVVS